MSGKWAKEFDASSKAYYYYNVETYETTWDRPSDFVEESGTDNLTVSEGMIMLKSVKRIQRGYRAKLARGSMRIKRAEKHAAENQMGNCKWVETYDPQSKASYYYHMDTHEVSHNNYLCILCILFFVYLCICVPRALLFLYIHIPLYHVY